MPTKNQHFVPRIYLKAWETKVETSKDSNKKFDGQMISIYLIVYSIGRFFIEGLRTDSLMIGSFKIAQTVSVVLIIVGFGIWIMRKNNELDGAYVKRC